MNIQFINPEGISKPTGYTHVVVGEGRKTVYLSGQIGVAPDGTVQEGLRAQTVQVFENIKTALASVGATFDNVVKMTTLVANYKTEDRLIIREVRAQYLSATNPPASTLMGVQALAVPEWLIEVEAIAVID